MHVPASTGTHRALLGMAGKSIAVLSDLHVPSKPPPLLTEGAPWLVAAVRAGGAGCRGAGPALHPRKLCLIHCVTPGASSIQHMDTQEGGRIHHGSFDKPHLFQDKKLRGNEKTKALLSLVLSSRGNETSKAPIQRGVGGGERNPTPDALEGTAFEMEMSLFRNIEFSSYCQGEGRRQRSEQGLLSHANPSGVHSGQHPGGPVERGFVRELIRTRRPY